MSVGECRVDHRAVLAEQHRVGGEQLGVVARPCAAWRRTGRLSQAAAGPAAGPAARDDDPDSSPAVRSSQRSVTASRSAAFVRKCR